MRMPSIISGITVVLFITACGAGTPQNEKERDRALAAWPLTTSSEEARQLVNEALRDEDMNRMTEAAALYERAVALDPSSAMLQLYAGGAAQNLETSYAHFQKAIDLATTAGEEERLLIEVYQKSSDNDAEGALAGAQRLVQLEPSNPRAYLVLAGMYDAVAQIDQKRAAFAKAIEVAPTFAPAYMVASANFATTEPRDLPKAEQLARKAVELEPNESYVHDILGDALRAQGKLEEAGQEYSKAAELDPTIGGPLQQRAHVNTFLGRYAEARADYDAATALATGNSKVRLPMYRSLVHIFEKDRKAAIAELEQLYASIDALNIPDPLGMKHFVAGPQFQIALWSGMMPEAERFADRLDELDKTAIAQTKRPEFERSIRGGIIYRRIEIAIHKGDVATARKKLDEYIALRAPEKNPSKERPVHVLRGFLAFQQGRNADAVREFEQGNPNNLYAAYEQAVALEALGRNAEARKLFDKITSTYFMNEAIAMMRMDVAARAAKPAI